MSSPGWLPNEAESGGRGSGNKLKQVWQGLRCIACIFQVPYRGDVGTYRVAMKALSIADPTHQLPFVPCIGAFHLQMEWVQVK